MAECINSQAAISHKDWNSFRIPADHQDPSPHVFVPQFQHARQYVDHRPQDIANHVEYIQAVNTDKRPSVRTLTVKGSSASDFIRTQHIDDILNQPQRKVTIRISEHTQVFWELPDGAGG